ncbi:MAG: lactate utilization protein [Lachnospiraceae bacterium]|nr:lactate utilization protein [Lachnospiraceae bacterium]
MTIKQKAYEKMAGGIIEKFQKRGFEGFYCNTKEEALEKALELIPEGASIAWGGSESIKEVGLLDALRNGKYELYDRSTAKTLEEQKEMYIKHISSDYFLMSANAITLDGELVNIDGNGNRVACLITGPKNVVVIAGMNKIAVDEEEAIKRVHNFAAPPNGVRLELTTPCSVTGKCGDCLSPDCMCCHTVITRKCRITNRIKIILVGEELGY